MRFKLYAGVSLQYYMSYLEYETHYFEFDDNGRYMDDWKVWHNDPLKAFSLLNRIFMGCNGLLILNEYKAVADILDRICKLEFKVVEAPNYVGFEDDLTDIFIYLLTDAQKNKDEGRYKKFYSSAKRRRCVDITRIAQALNGIRG